MTMPAGMRVKGWLLIGDGDAAGMLPQHMALVNDEPLPYLPDAGACQVGRWIRWQPGLAGPVVTAVCVEVPL